MKLHTGEVRAVLLVEVGVQRGEDGLIHLGDFVLVVGKRHIETCTELALLDHILTIDIELPTIVDHIAHILISQGSEA